MKLQMAAIAGMIAMLLGYAHAQDSIHLGADVDAALLDPRIMRDTTAFRVCDLLFDGLIELDAKSQPQPGLAQSWDHPDATTWIFHLRDAKFADGTPVSADDVAYTFQTTLDPKMASRFRGWLTPIKAITATDAHTVRMELSQPYAPLLGYMELGIVPKAVAAAPNADLSAHPVGSGPMRLAGWKRGNSIVLEANPGYWGGAPKLKRLEIVVVGDNTARAQALEAGDLDFIQSPLSPQDVHRLMGEQKFAHVDASGQALTFLLFNTSDPTLADPEMRRALAHLIDQKTILSQIYGGIDQPANEMLLPTSLGYDASLRQPAFDPAEAGKELDALGWKRGADGKRAKDGKKLAITLSTHSEDPNRVQTMEFLQAVFTDAGIETKVSLADFPSFFAAVRDGRTQIALLGMALNVPDPDRVLYDQMHTGGGNNWAHYGNPEVDAALEQGRRGDDRLAAYRKAETILTRDLPLYVLSYQGYQAFYRPALHFEPNPRGYLRSLLW
ncbi:MAG TPA: ABC transporter substrate-binding protein [Acetobacteraceae bacterium]|jgi:peptide/nickel transport system substrate-binding protein